MNKLTDDEVEALALALAAHPGLPLENPVAQKLVAEVRAARAPLAQGMVERATEWLVWMGWESSPFNAPQSLAALLTSVQNETREVCAVLCDLEENDCAGLCAAAIRAKIGE